jgi:hypothetical protein
VPNGASSGAISVTTSVGTGTSAKTFAPTFSLQSFYPSRAKPNALVSLTGVGFTSSSEVFFDGTRASATYVSSTKLKVTVPAEAQTGPITVLNGVNPAGTVSGVGNFVVEG